MKNSHRLAITAFVSVGLCSGAARAIAWDDCGHKTVATIALDQLTPKARNRIDAIFKKDLRKRHFVDSAVWPDDIKRGERNGTPFTAPMNKPWHYVNIPYDASGQEIDTVINKVGVTVDPAHASSANVVTAIRYYSAVLKSGSGSAPQQADALSWLVHLVGDVHQPLHTLLVRTPLPNYVPPATGDAGGNGFTIQGTPGELHAYWDDILDLHTRDGSDANARQLASALEAKIKPGPFGMGKTDPAQWARESYAVRKFVYSPERVPNTNPADPIEHHVISADYAKKARPIAGKRIVYAGYRLAKLLNSIYGAP